MLVTEWPTPMLAIQKDSLRTVIYASTVANNEDSSPSLRELCSHGEVIRAGRTRRSSDISSTWKC